MADASASLPTFPIQPSGGAHNPHVRFKSESGQLLLLLPPESEGMANRVALTWSELWQQLKQHLDGGDRFWQPGGTVHLMANDRLLDARQLQAIADALSHVQLSLTRVYTSRRQTAVAAVTAGYSVEQRGAIAQLTHISPEDSPVLSDPLYLQTTVRSGTDIRHNGTIVILGDTNPGSNIIAAGDILIWGALRGVAHAGTQGNTQCRIMALQMQPTQIRIAHHIARAPATPPAQYQPEVAFVMDDSIRIVRAGEFPRLLSTPIDSGISVI